MSGQELRLARQRAGWTQGQLAERLNVALRTVGSWERGHVPPSRVALVMEQLGDHWLLPGVPDSDILSEFRRRGLITALTAGEILADMHRRIAQGHERRPELDEQATGTERMASPSGGGARVVYGRGRRAKPSP